MQNLITTNGFIGALKWNGALFSTYDREYSRIILPRDIDSNIVSAFSFFKQYEGKFRKKHTEGIQVFDSDSLVYEIPFKVEMEVKSILQLGILWAFNKNGRSFLNFGLIEELIQHQIL